MGHRAALQEFVRTKLKATRVVVVSNRQPYLHGYDGDRITWRRPAGGLVVALDPVLRVAKGSWVATGQTEADRNVLDAEGRVRVPPEDPQYTLRRVWLTKRSRKRGTTLAFATRSSGPSVILSLPGRSFGPLTGSIIRPSTGSSPMRP